MREVLVWTAAISQFTNSSRSHPTPSVVTIIIHVFILQIVVVILHLSQMRCISSSQESVEISSTAYFTSV